MAKSVKDRLDRVLGRSTERRRRGRSGRVVREVSGFRMHLDLGDHGISRTLYSKGGREQCFMYLLNREVREGMVCLDLGANIGYATLSMCRNVGPTGFVYAIEPSSHNLELLRLNIAENHFADRCEITEGLISSTTGSKSFWLSKHPNLGSVDKAAHSVKQVTLPSYSLADFCANRRPVDFIKMDVEGHEVEILKGGIDYFRSHTRPMTLLFEVHSGAYRAEDRFDEVLRAYVDCGFRARYVISTPMAHAPIFRDAGYSPKHIFYSDNRERGVYENVAEADMIRMVCFETDDTKTTGKVRAVMLQRA